MTYATPIIASFLGASWIAVITRCYVRVGIVRKFGRDDVAMVVAELVFSGLCSTAIWVDLVSREREALAMPWATLRPVANVTFSANLLYIIAAFCLKIALGLLLLRVFVKRWMVIVTYLAMAIPTAYGTFYFFYILFMCGNPNQFAIKFIFEDQLVCISSLTIDWTCYLHASINAIADWTFCILPIVLVLDINMPLRSKIAVASILCLGSVGSIFSCIRFGWIKFLGSPADSFLVHVRTIALLSIAELGTGIVCCSLATMRPLFHYFRTGEHRSGGYLSHQEPTESSIAMAQYDIDTRYDATRASWITPDGKRSWRASVEDGKRISGMSDQSVNAGSSDHSGHEKNAVGVAVG